MARRVLELEQEAAESRDEFSSLHQDQGQTMHQPFAAAEGGGGLGGFNRRVSVGGGSGDRAEERALRAKNEMLERQLAHMREAAEEAQLELAAARKVKLGGVCFFGVCGGGWRWTAAVAVGDGVVCVFGWGLLCAAVSRF